ncbi:fimbria/pilus outer membrane usher protein [Pseudomonas abieticivorans]|uniref:fimbria/pilus outer membrane usher protein n=1 Tax=Pseudomonas abieticivorans TaxID=2931382 RepID=UPI0020C1094F|nr:fimbria/pilus outer membrane usher protein [Pseudomonas sp. PIA16]
MSVASTLARLPKYSALTFWASTMAIAAPQATTANEPGFDIQTLKQRGIDPDLSQYFAQSTRFAPGARRVNLTVNGSPRGPVNVQFDDQGQPCFDSALLTAAGLRAAPEANEQQKCQAFLVAFPRSVIKLSPSRQQVELIVSDDALQQVSTPASRFESGGRAASLNYEWYGSTNRYGGDANHYQAANVQLGFNLGDWLVRSRHGYTAFGDNSRIEHLYTYGQKTLVEHGGIVQVGEIGISHSALPGIPITGLQWVPENALQRPASSGVQFQGFAQDTARVEVRQGGALIHDRMVPGGPFELRDLPLTNSHSDLEVRVIEGDGREQRYTVPAISLGAATLAAPGLSFALGKVRTYDSRGIDSPMLATASNGWRVGQRHLLALGGMASENQYQAMALTLDSNLSPDVSLGLGTLLSHGGRQAKSGAQFNGQLQVKWPYRFSTSLNVSRETAGYQDLTDTLPRRSDPASYYRSSYDQYGLSLNWFDPAYGAFSTTYASAVQFNGQRSDYIVASWNRNIGRLNLGVRLERNTREVRYTGIDTDHFERQQQSAAYLSVSMPLGPRSSVRSFASRRGDRQTLSSTYNDQINDRLATNVTADYESPHARQSLTAGLSLLTDSARTQFSLTQGNEGRRSASAQATGGIAWHDDGLTFSPYPIGDTFAIASVGQVAGIKLQTPSGPVWTDQAGQAVIAHLPAYQRSQVEVATRSLPTSVDVVNGYQSITAGRGSVHHMAFSVVQTRRALLTLNEQARQLLNKGDSILDAQGRFVTVVLDDGQIFLDNADTQGLGIYRQGSRLCNLLYELPEQPERIGPYETLDAQCQQT